jgi:hypothetical protein
MGFNIWLLVVRGTKMTERELLKRYCLFAFGIPAIATSTALILRRNEAHFSAVPRKYFCDFDDTMVTRWTYGVPMFLAALPSVLFACEGKNALTAEKRVA